MQEKFFKKDEIIFKEGDSDFFLYKVIKGKIFSFIVQGSKVTPTGENLPGSFAGSNTFFLKKPTGTYAIATEDTAVEIYTQEDLDANFPNWLKTIAKSIARKTEEQMLQIADKGIRRATGAVKPLSIEEQRHYLQLIKSE